jgi:transcriptional regulator with XRE-family HTH domain
LTYTTLVVYNGFMLNFMEFIKHQRKSRKLTQFEFAKLLGVTQQAIAKYESGRSIHPSPALALRIERATGGAVSRDELLFPELYAVPPPSDGAKVAQ